MGCRARKISFSSLSSSSVIFPFKPVSFVSSLVSCVVLRGILVTCICSCQSCQIVFLFRSSSALLAAVLRLLPSGRMLGLDPAAACRSPLETEGAVGPEPPPPPPACPAAGESSATRTDTGDWKTLRPTLSRTEGSRPSLPVVDFRSSESIQQFRDSAGPGC